MRIALVNDLELALVALRRIVESLPDARLAWTAKDGAEAVQRCLADTPDLILMDMIMPVMDGVEATRQIMQQCPCPIVVVTATVAGNADRVYEALGHGALDAVNTPVLGTGGSLSGAEELIRKIRMVRRLVSDSPAPLPPPATEHGRPSRTVPAVQMVAIGSSTGGPQALVKVLMGLPHPLPFGVTVVQHIDREFVPGLARWLAAETRLTVGVIGDAEPHRAGGVGVAATGEHLILDTQGQYRYVQQPADHVHRPSVDVFFESLLRAPIWRGAAVLLTGMGRDGAAGLLGLRRAGWYTIAQDRATSVVWGMPGAAAQLGAAVDVLPIEAIGAAIARHMSGVKGSPSRE